jgi:H+-transporting ATPase
MLFGIVSPGRKLMNREVIQTLIYLKLSVAGHLTSVVTRTCGPFWSTRRAPVLLSAVIGTPLIATCFAVFGWLMPPIGWRWALAIWGYARAWFLVNDRVKLAACGILNPRQPVLSARR